MIKKSRLVKIRNNVMRAKIIIINYSKVKKVLALTNLLDDLKYLQGNFFNA